MIDLLHVFPPLQYLVTNVHIIITLLGMITDTKNLEDWSVHSWKDEKFIKNWFKFLYCYSEFQLSYLQTIIKLIL